MKKCFVVSEIGMEGSEVRERADKVFKYIIKPVCENCGYEAIRVDQINSSDSITQTIIDELRNSEIVIADITGHNPNAFYEMEYRTCLNKPIIHLKEKNETIPFDITTIRTFEYDLLDLGSVEEIKNRLERTINSLTFDESEKTGEVEISNGENVTILSILYEIQDKVTELCEEVKRKDSETIQAIMQTSLNNVAKAEPMETTLLKTLLPELMRNPKSIKNLMELSNIVQEKPAK